MKLYPFCQPYVWENPKVLLATGFTWKSHKEGPCASEIVNHIIFIYIIAFAVGVLSTVAAGQAFAMTGFFAFATLYCLPSFWALVQARSTFQEGYQDVNGGVAAVDASVAATAGTAEPMYDVIGSGTGAASKLTLPTARNPFMNVLIDEINYNPTRGVAASVLDPSVKVTLDEFFRTSFHSDPTDVFGKSQSQRQFVSMPSTGIPNDQGSYQDWLYRIPGKTCKEGGREACLPGTDGGALPWLNKDA